MTMESRDFLYSRRVCGGRWSVAALEIAVLVAAAIAVLPIRAQNPTSWVTVDVGPEAIAINTVTDKIYIANWGGNDVTVIDGASNATATVFVGTEPIAIALNPMTNRIYVANQGSNSVAIIDGASNALTGVAVGTGPLSIAANPTTNRIYVANQASNNVTVIDGATNATSTVAVGVGPCAIAVNPITGKIYVVNQGSNTVTVIDGATNATTTVGVGNLPLAVAVNPATNKVYVANSNGVIPGSGSISVIDGASSIVTTIPVETPIAVAVNPVTNKIYVADAYPTHILGGGVTVIDGASNVATVVPTGDSPVAFAVNTATDRIYVKTLGGTGVKMIDGVTNSVSNVYAGGESPAIAVNPLTNTVYSAYFLLTGEDADEPGSVAVIDGSAVPSFASEPLSQTVNAGDSVILTATATGMPPLNYEWLLNGGPVGGAAGVSGALSPNLYLSGVTAANAGDYTCLVFNNVGNTTSLAATLTVASTSTPSRLINISCRAQVGKGANQLIVGFVMGGRGTSGTIPLLIRASGPALEQFGVSDFLPDPELQLNIPGNVTVTNEGWGGSAQIASAASAAGAFAWTDPSSHDSALLQYLAGGAYTVQVTGASGDTGVALAEIYDVTPPDTYAAAVTRLINISARTNVGLGSDVAIVGFVVGGATSETVLIRGSGPALGTFGIPGPLPDPKLDLYMSNGDGTSTLIASDTGWQGDAQIATAAAAAGAFSWGSSATPDSAILMTLPPGAYTAKLSGASDDTGIGLVEVYEVP